MKLTTEELPNYFTIATPQNSHYSKTTNCFDFVDRNSDTLLVTVGDSWTWGACLNVENRLYEIYGNLISDEIKADFLNLGQSGANNFFIAERVEELGKIVLSLGYKKIYLICTFTETGRSFDSRHDEYINYVNWFEQNKIENFLAFLNQECYNRIFKVAQNYNMVLRVGTNFVDPIGYSADIPPWFRLIGIECPISGCVGTTGASQLYHVKQFIRNRDQFKKWFSDLVDSSRYVERRLGSKLLNAHPTPDQHALWANAIMKTLK